MKNKTTRDAVDAFRGILFEKECFGRTFKSHITYSREGYEIQTGIADTDFDGDTHSRRYGEISIGYFGGVTRKSGHYVLFNPHFLDFIFENGCLTVNGTGGQPGREGAFRVEIRPL